MEYVKLIGVLIIVLGFAFKLDTLAVVIIAAITTGLASGMSVTHMLAMLGKGFMDNRMVSLFCLALPMIGVVERFGLREAAINIIKKFKNITPGKLQNYYLILRDVTGMCGINIQGQVQFVRPLISPMAQAAASVKHKLNKDQIELIKGRSAATDNFGNFFGQNLFIASSGVLLMASTMKSLGHAIKPTSISLWSIPVCLVTLIIVWLYNMHFDKKLKAMNDDTIKEDK